MKQANVTANEVATAKNTRRFGIMVLPDAPVPELIERFQRAEALGFDQLFLPDHIANPFDASPPWFDGWTLLAAAAAYTRQIRIGTLVSNPILRSPAVLAKEAMTIDHLSCGRLDLGIGAGIYEFDHDAVGSATWPVKERVGRFAEYVEILDGILRAKETLFRFEGRWNRVRGVPTAPGPAQHPRPPIIVGGQAPTILRVAVERADVWNTNGRFGAELEEILELTLQQNRRLDELCAEVGRDPATLRRSLLVWGATDPLISPVSLEDLVERFTAVGINEFVLGWPDHDGLEDLERLSLAVIPTLRDG